MDALNNAERIELELDRDAQVLHPSSVVSIQTSDDFYDHTLEELRKEQRLR